MASEDSAELLFFDTFSHDINEELNLDLVQFPKPVYITEVRIIPLGARVQADFPGGVRLGATNPSQFHIDFFVNDLGKPGASTFENLGSFEYNQNDCINLECDIIDEENYRQIPTDGLVLRGWYTTITLAVYGTFTKQITDLTIASPPPVVQPEIISAVPVQITTGNELVSGPIVSDVEWPREAVSVPVLDSYPVPTPTEVFEVQDPEYFPPAVAVVASDAPKDPRTYNAVTGAPEWAQVGSIEEWDRPDRRGRCKSKSAERPESREKSRGFSRSSSREHDFTAAARSKRDWSRSPEYRSHRKGRGSPPYERSRRDHDRRSPESDDQHRKRPRTPPISSPPRSRPRSPDRPISTADLNEDDLRYRSRLEKAKHMEKFQPIRVIDHSIKTLGVLDDDSKPMSPQMGMIIDPLNAESPTLDDETMLADEQFEPILSDEEIGDDVDTQFDLNLDFSDMEDAIKKFNPLELDVKKFDMQEFLAENSDQPSTENNEIQSPVTQHLNKDCDNVLQLLRKFKSRCDYFEYSQFLCLPVETKECWVHFTEQLIQCLSLFGIQYHSRTHANDLLKLKIVDDPDLSLILVDWVKIGLNFEMSLSQPQPGYKIRHIKAGIRLVEMLLCYDSLAQLILFDCSIDVFAHLFDMYGQNFMALSIKLMIIKAIHSAIDSPVSIEFLLGNCGGIGDGDDDNINCDSVNGYQKLLRILKDNPLTRIKFAVKSLIKKINYYESLKFIRELVSQRFVLNEDDNEEGKCLDEDCSLLESCLNEIWPAITYNECSYLQPKRFLPVSAKFDFTKDAVTSRAISVGILSHFQSTAFLESILLLVIHREELPPHISGLVLQILSAILKKSFGLEYMADNIETTNHLIRTLFMEIRGDTEDVLNYRLHDSQSLDIGLEIWFKLQAKYQIDAIINLKNHQSHLIEILHTLYSLTCDPLGRPFVVETICMDTNLIPLLNFIEMEKKIEKCLPNGTPPSKIKSPVLNYSVDLIDCVVRHSIDLQYLEDYGNIILDFVKCHELFESSVSAMFQELSTYLKPLEIPNVFSYNDITGICELIKRSMDFVTTFPGDLITALRIVRFLGVPSYEHSVIESDMDPIEPEFIELRYKFIVLELYSHDGVSIMLNIFEKLTTYFEQPGIHSATLMSGQGVLITQIVLPAIQILRRMLVHVIKCRNTAYKDLTPIEPILKIYNLMYHVPRDAPAYRDSKLIQAEVVRILLAFTQPLPLEGVDTESVHKSLWTQMIGELVKYTLIGPSTFIPGLLIIGELLPLPLPIVTREHPSQVEISKLITVRQLWSAHLHPQSTVIGELIQTICVSNHPQLVYLLCRICFQLADLAPNMTLLVSKTLIDMICNETIAAVMGATRNMARLLGVLAELVEQPSIKVSVLSILPGKLIETFSSILTTVSTAPGHLIAEEHVKTILQQLLNSENTLITPDGVGSREMTLACALPSKEILWQIIIALLTNLTTQQNVDARLVSTVRTMIPLTEHDFTIFHLRSGLESKAEQIHEYLSDILSGGSLEKADSLSLVHEILEFLLALITNEQTVNSESWTSKMSAQIPQRSIVLQPHQFARILGWKQDDNENTEHTIRKFKNNLELEMKKVKNVDEESTEAIIQTSLTKVGGKLLENVLKIIGHLEKQTGYPGVSENSNTSSSDFGSPTEPILPQAEGIVTQFSLRQFYELDHDEGSDEKLNVKTWLSSPNGNLNESSNVDPERVSCDLSELIKLCLPTETNITSECKRLLHLSASPQAARERTATAPCYRTRRVEVEPTTGRPEKRIFITPMRGRGFPRTPPSRGDLFRSRPPNTSRPPSLHVDDFLALETCGAQPTGPTGYNKLSRDIISIRGSRGRGRGFNSDRGRIQPGGMNMQSPGYRQPGGWQGHVNHMQDPNQHFRTATSEPVVSSHFPPEQHYPPHFGGPSRGRIARGFSRGRPFNR